VSKEVQDHSSASSDAPTEDTLTNSSKVEGTSPDEQNENEMTLADALSQNLAKDASLASVEELHTLAGGADIKVPTREVIVLRVAVSCSLLYNF